MKTSRRYVLYETRDLKKKKRSDEKQQTEIKRKLTKKGEEINRGLAEITSSIRKHKCNSRIKFPA